MSHLPIFSGRRVLLLQGPVGPFFWRLAQDLRQQGAEVFKFNFNAGDWLFYPKDAHSYRGHLQNWPSTLDAFMREQRIDVVLLFGDCRPVHMGVREICQQQGSTVGVFEEGYLRPNFVTFELGGVNGHSSFPELLQAWLIEQTQNPALDQALPPVRQIGNSYFHAAAWGMLYFLVSWLFQTFWNNALHHRTMTVFDSPRWWLSFGRKAWYKLAEAGIQKKLCSPFYKQFFLIPFQVYNDAQLLVHSGFNSMEEFADHVMASYAAALRREQAEEPSDGFNALAKTKLVFKHHPMDRGHRHYGSMLTRLSRRYGLEGRVLYIHDQHLPSLLKAARGVIVINSTVGLSALNHNTAVKACGKALYDLPNITYQGTLDDFWQASPQVRADTVALQRLNRVLISHTQINGNFYRRLRQSGWQCGLNPTADFSRRLWPRVQTPGQRPPPAL